VAGSPTISPLAAVVELTPEAAAVVAAAAISCLP